MDHSSLVNAFKELKGPASLLALEWATIAENNFEQITKQALSYKPKITNIIGNANANNLATVFYTNSNLLSTTRICIPIIDYPCKLNSLDSSFILAMLYTTHALKIQINNLVQRDRGEWLDKFNSEFANPLKYTSIGEWEGILGDNIQTIIDILMIILRPYLQAADGSKETFLNFLFLFYKFSHKYENSVRVWNHLGALPFGFIADYRESRLPIDIINLVNGEFEYNKYFSDYLQEIIKSNEHIWHTGCPAIINLGLLGQQIVNYFAFFYTHFHLENKDLVINIGAIN